MKHNPMDSGQCCCICKHQLKLMCHPWNKTFGRGSISKQCGWVCTVMYGDESNKGQGLYFDGEHGLCELFKSKHYSRIS